MLDQRATMNAEKPTPEEREHERMLGLLRIVKRIAGMLNSLYAAQGLPIDHPYRQACSMVRSYLDREYGL